MLNLTSGGATTWSDLLEQAPVLALVLTTDCQVARANRFATQMLGPAAGCPFRDLLVFPMSFDVPAAVCAGAGLHRVTLKTVTRLPETYLFQFLPLPDGIFALGHTDPGEHARLQRELLALNRDISSRTRELHQANAELRDVGERLHSLLVTRTAELVDTSRTLERAHQATLGLRDQLAQAERMEAIGQLAGGIAHDFNNMLSVIIGRLELALQDLGPGAPARTDLLEAQAAAQQSSDLVRQLLTFARKSTGAPRVIDLNATIAGLISMLRRLIGEQIQLEWLPSHSTPWVRIDPVQVAQVITNLCANARDAMSGPGRITIATSVMDLDAAACAGRPEIERGPVSIVTVADTGSGIPAEALEHIFEPFFTTKAPGRGTGLGLATVAGVVRQNGGFIDVESEVGRGTTFRVGLPAVSEGATVLSTGQTPRPAPTGGNETVLLVEDETAVLRLVAMMLKQLGYTVITAQTPGRALEVAAGGAQRIDLLVSDVVMPEMSGRELATRLAVSQPGARVLFMSGYATGALTRDHLLDEGAPFVQKPFTLHTIAAAVRDALDHPPGSGRF